MDRHTCKYRPVVWFTENTCHACVTAVCVLSECGVVDAVAVSPGLEGNGAQ